MFQGKAPHILVAVTLITLLCTLYKLQGGKYCYTSASGAPKPRKVEVTQGNVFLRSIAIDLPGKKIEYFKYLPNLTLNKKNKAKIGHGECIPPAKMENPKKMKMILMTDFIPYFEKVHRDKSEISGSRPPTDDEIDARLYEVVETLQLNLNHEHIQAIYVFVDSLTAVDYLSSLNLINSENLVIQHLPKQHTIKTYVEFAAGCFMDRIVVIGQQDILFGKGWDQVSYKVLSESRLMYALTRQPAYIAPIVSIPTLVPLIVKHLRIWVVMMYLHITLKTYLRKIF